MKISVDDKADRDALAAILARNGYIVKMTRYKKTAKLLHHIPADGR